MITRRQFLGRAVPIVAAGAFVAEELTRTIFLPPAIGWFSTRDMIYRSYERIGLTNTLVSEGSLTLESLNEMMVRLSRSPVALRMVPTKLLVHPSWIGMRELEDYCKRVST